MNGLKPIPYYVKALAMAIPAVLIGIQIPTWFVVIPSRSIELQADFRVLYTAGYMVRTGETRDLYNYPAVRAVQSQVIADDGAAVPFIHPAYETLLFVPLSLLSYRAAYLLWVAVNCCLLIVISRFLRLSVGALVNLLPWLPFALVPSFFPISFALMQGQDSILLLFVLLLTYRCIADHEFAAGLVLGFGMFRFQVLLPILLLFLWWRAWKFLLGCLLSTCGVSALSIAIAGMAGQVQYLHLLQSLAALPYLELTNRMTNIRGVVTALGGGVALTALLSASIVVVVAIRSKAGLEERFLISVSVSSLVAYHFFLHDFCILLLPLMAALNSAVSREDWRELALLGIAFSFPTVVWFANARIYVIVLSTALLFWVQMSGALEAERLPPLEDR